MLDEQHLRWKYWTPLPCWDGSRSFVWEQGGELLAHAGVVPLEFTVRGETRRLVQLIDWAARPESMGAGVALLRDLSAQVDGALSVRGSPMTRALLAPLGFRSLVDPCRLVTHPRARTQLETTTRLFDATSFDDAEDPIEWHGVEGMLRPRRTRAQVRHWLACPAAPMTYGEVLRAGRRIGGFLLARTPGQVRVCDVQVPNDEPQTWIDVVLAAREAAESLAADNDEIVSQANHAPEVAAFERAGFTRTESDPLAILANPSWAPDGVGFVHHLIDSDLAYLHHGARERWTIST